MFIVGELSRAIDQWHIPPVAKSQNLKVTISFGLSVFDQVMAGESEPVLTLVLF
jgi:hypothetical protein